MNAMSYIVTGKDLTDAWINAMKLVLKKGTEMPDDDGERKELTNVGVFVANPEAGDYEGYFNYFDRDLFDRVKDLYNRHGSMTHHGFNYADRIYNHHGIDQVEKVINMLRQNSLSNSAVITLIDPVNDKYHTPCVLNIVFKIRENKLVIWVLFKSSDIPKKFIPDMLGIMELHRHVASELKCELGSIKAFILSGLVYKKNYSHAKGLIKNYGTRS